MKDGQDYFRTTSIAKMVKMKFSQYKKRMQAIRRRQARGRLARGTQFYGKKIKQPVHFFTRTAYRPAYFALPAGGAAVGTAINFKLSDLPNASEFTQLYDQYQIKGVKITLIPRYTDVNVGQTQGNVWSVLDYDDSNVPTSIDTLMQYQNVKRTRMNQIHSRYLKPAVSKEVYATGIATSYSMAKNTWMDAANDSVEHYGIKMWFDTRQVLTTIDVQLKFYLAFKNVR